MASSIGGFEDLLQEEKNGAGESTTARKRTVLLRNDCKGMVVWVKAMCLKPTRAFSRDFRVLKEKVNYITWA